MLPKAKKITYNEFIEIDKNSDEFLEFIDGEIFNQASPSTAHQRISRKLSTKFELYFEKKECEPFIAPFDIHLKNEKEEHISKVIPDISVICDKNGLNENNYNGVPTLIVEILSPSNQSHDLITKMNLYQRFGVKEYWIINPNCKSIQIYALDSNGFYNEVGVFKNNEIVTSNIFLDLKINLNDIFNN